MRYIKIKHLQNEVEVYVDQRFITEIDLSQDVISQWTDECVAQGDTEKGCINQWLGLEANKIGAGLYFKRYEHDYLVRQLKYNCSEDIKRAYKISKKKFRES